MSGSGGWLSSWFKAAPPQPSVETQVQDAVNTNEETLSQLQERYEEQGEIIRQLGENVKRLYANGSKAEAQRIFQQKQRKEKAQTLLAGKIASLSTVNDNVHGMHENVSVHSAMVQSNAASARIGATLNVENVDGTMAMAAEYATDHREVSELLGGSTLMDPVDEDEMMADLEAFVGVDMGSGKHNPVYQQQQVPPPMNPAERQAYEARNIEMESEMARMLNTMPPVPQTAPLSLQQRQVLAQSAARLRK